MVSGGKTTLCDYSMLFSLVIYREKTARSDFEQEPSRSSGVWADIATTISVMRLNANGCTCMRSHPIFPPFFPLFPLQPLLPPIIPLTPPLKQINCLRPPRRNGTTTRNDNQMFLQRFFPPTTLYLQSYTVSQQSRP